MQHRTALPWSGCGVLSCSRCAGGVNRLDAHASSVNLHARPGEWRDSGHHGCQGKASLAVHSQAASLQAWQILQLS